MNAELAQIVEHLREQQATVELKPYSDDPSFVAPTFRTRVINAGDNGMVLQRPLQAEAAGCFHPRAIVSVLVIDAEGQRWELISRVQRSMKVKLNEKSDTPALLLNFPHELRSGQRRSFYRVATRASELDSILLVPQDCEHRDGVPEKQQVKSFNAALLNISGGGAGVLAPPEMREQLSRTRYYTCRITLPVLGFPMMIPICIVHREILEDGQTYLGLAFDFDDDRGDRDRIVDEVCRFATHLQRDQLRKQALKR